MGAHERKKPVRKTLPADLPCVDVIHDIDDEDKRCACGADKKCMGAEVSEDLDVVPAIYQVLRHLRLKYVCRRCEGTEEPDKPTVAIAPLPLKLIAKSIASPGLLAHIITAKFVDATPLYRQQSQFSRMGIDLSRGTMSSWVIKVGEACERLVEFLCQEVVKGRLVQCDETRLQVLKEEGRAATTESYAWVFTGGEAKQRTIVFVYDPSRSGTVAKTFLNEYRGHVLTDAYAGYDFLEKMIDVVHHGRWAHARRGFVDVIKAADEVVGEGDSIAQQAVARIRKLYEVEWAADKAKSSVDERAQLRAKRSKPLLESLRAWLLEIQPTVAKKSLLGKAIAYTLDEWPRLVAYADTGFVPLDNNGAENAIRPFVVGRKNWLFAETPAGATAMVRLYSLIETAKANGIDPYWYLRFLFEKLPNAKSDSELRALLPMYIGKSVVQRYVPPR